MLRCATLIATIKDGTSLQISSSSGVQYLLNLILLCACEACMLKNDYHIVCLLFLIICFETCQFLLNQNLSVQGVVTDAITGVGIEGAKVSVEGVNYNVTTSSRGEYWRLLLPGTYTLVAKAYG